MPARARKSANTVVNTPAQRSTSTVAPAADVAPGAGGANASHDEVARRAFELYCARGREDGRDLDDWLQAERELRATPRGVGD